MKLFKAFLIFFILISFSFGQRFNNQKVVLNFNNANIEDVAKFFSKLLHENIVVDSSVKGNITVSSSKPVNTHEAWDIFTLSLALNGYGTVKKDGFIKIVPLKEAQILNSNVSITPKKFSKPLSTYVYFSNTNPNLVLNAIRPFLSQYGQVSVYQPSKALIISDISTNLLKIEKILNIIDKTKAKWELRSYKVPTEKSDSIIKALTPLSNAFSNELGQNVIVSSSNNIGTILVYAPKNLQHIFKKAIEDFNNSLENSSKNFYVITLKNASVEEISKTLSSLFGMAGINTGSFKPQGITETSLQNKDNKGTQVPHIVRNDEIVSSIELKNGTKIGFDRATNSVLIYTSQKDYEKIKALIEKLDKRRQQVLLAAYIVEASLSKMLNLGVQWQILGTQGGSSFGGALTTQGIYNAFSSNNFITGIIGKSLINTTINGQTIIFPDLALFLSMLESNSGINVISAPKVLTMDNEEAIMKVGTIQPYPSSESFDINHNPIITYDYKDVGLELDVTPTVSNKNVKMDINLILRNIIGYVPNGCNTNIGSSLQICAPVVSNRTLNSEVVVKSGQSVVIGGLINNSTQNTNNKVPILGDIPVLGYLFKNEQKQKTKETLFVFITPYIINSPKQLSEITALHEKLAKEILKEKSIK